MFEEISFDDVDVSCASHEDDRLVAENVADAVEGGKAFVRFHRPGEEGFSIVAGACDDKDARHDAHFMSGDAWMSKDCHCIQCETLRVLSRYSEMRAQPNISPVIVLVDLDNFGFNQFKSIPPYPDVELLDHVLVWSFFGSCFTRHHRAWPSEQTVCEPLPNRAVSVNAAGTTKRSIWEILVSKQQVFFTPCGGQTQAADNVMHRVLQALQGMETVLLTGDVKLINEIYRSRRLLGMKSRRHNEDEMSDKLTVINVDDMDKRFVPVWRSLCNRLRGTLHDVGATGSCNDSDV
ncbi:hypothetical protein, conserved [Leishmania donovani]|uniref:Uncharacterized protein n=1 Tax=Leishmania donovani TaxID=5661 RepID=A0A3S7X5I4_LEIDO|nr:hypothetical protein, conserved [Leishmania donovani]AYU81716.1 hypothetical protein LdCL_320022400 [Leishmania donovani]TPP43680.1 hypothetical protein CGC21_20395 [Leishmania donovani]CBZ36900.1 hypothetical protein, conserved [Leishmania donovani]